MRALPLILLLTASLSALAQVPTVKEPSVTTENLPFHCEPSFHNTGDGVCSGGLVVALSNVPYRMNEAETTCTIRVEFLRGTHPNSSRASQTIEVTSPLKVDKDGLWARQEVPFSIDVTSVMERRTQTSVVSQGCSARWKYR